MMLGRYFPQSTPATSAVETTERTSANRSAPPLEPAKSQDFLPEAMRWSRHSASPLLISRRPSLPHNPRLTRKANEGISNQDLDGFLKTEAVRFSPLVTGRYCDFNEARRDPDLLRPVHQLRFRHTSNSTKFSLAQPASPPFRNKRLAIRLCEVGFAHVPSMLHAITLA